MTRNDLENSLKRYMPEPAVEMIATHIIELRVHLRITKARSSKLGDYRAPFDGQGHRISINHNLNKYAFLVTMVHELAHLTCWNRHKHAVDPHGREWKNDYKQLMAPFLVEEIFPKDVLFSLQTYLRNPAASSCSDPNLLKALSRYDDIQSIMLEELPHGSVFGLSNNMVFRKGEKKRTRYRCQELRSNRFYMVSAVAEVIQLDPHEWTGRD